MRKIFCVAIIIIILFFWIKNFISKGGLLTFLDSHPHSVWTPRVLYIVGNICFLSGDYKNAIVYFKRIPTKFPKAKKSIDAEYMIGRSYEVMKAFPEARKVYEEILEKYPKSKYTEIIQKKLQVFLH